MDQEFYYYIRSLHQFIEVQEKRIRSLEKSLETLSNEVTSLKKRPPIQVGNIEYKFDQLKVETLEGTLNIGLNPSDLEAIDELAVDNKSIKTPISPKIQMQRSMELEEKALRYLEEKLPAIYENTLEKLNYGLDDSYLSFIKEDIKVQLPKRIDHYLRSFSVQEPLENENELHEKILQQLEKEIENGVYAFISNLPENVRVTNK